MQDAPQPLEIPDIGGVVEPHFLAQVGEGNRRCGLSEDGLRDVAGQDLCSHEDQHGDGEQQKYAQRNALGNQSYDR